MAELTREAQDSLILAISKIIVNTGLKATTMDMVANALSMSKRTLYEIFGSKNEMILRVVAFWQETHRKNLEAIFKQSDNVMEALYRASLSHQQMMREVNVDFFHDMDEHFKNVRKSYDEDNKKWRDNTMRLIDLGIRQGVFRDDVNYSITLQLIRIQMESLKRMEENFPPEITISDAFNVITTGLLRSIATPKGMEILDNILLEENKKATTE